jgi:hypothetical protein
VGFISHDFPLSRWEGDLLSDWDIMPLARSWKPLFSIPLEVEVYNIENL